MALVTEATTRERLVAAAIEVFRRDGYERARVQDIAREAGLTTGAIYANYRGKAELLYRGDRPAHRARTRRTAAQRRRRSTVELLALLADRLLRRDGDRPLLLEAVVGLARDPELAAMLRAGIAAREARFGALVDRGEATTARSTTSVDTETMARFCVMLAFGSMVLRTVDVDAGDREAWHALIERLLGASRAGIPECTP